MHISLLLTERHSDPKSKRRFTFTDEYPMRLIDEIEISYFRSFYKFKIKDLRDLNVIFGKNDSGKSNIVRALSMFFAGAPDHAQEFEFPIDFSEKRSIEAEESEGVRKFLYVKITFNTPPSFQRSLGEKFYVKRQWTISRGGEYHEEISGTIPANRRHIATRFLNKIKFIYIPAIKDIRIFEMLLAEIHETIAQSNAFLEAVQVFSESLQENTREMFTRLPAEVSQSTRIGAPNQLSELFQTLDFETISEGERTSKSLTRQRGDGVKVRHIPELLSFICENDPYDYHIWGFEEPENSLDFVAAQSEAVRLLSLAKGSAVQIFITTHSPSFYLLDDEAVTKCYVRKDTEGVSNAIQGQQLDRFDIHQAVGEGFYLPAVSEALKNLADIEAKSKAASELVDVLREELRQIAEPVVLTEGRTDARILNIAWEKLRGGRPPFSIRSCETGGENAGGGNGGAQSLAVRLRGIAADHPHAVIGLFDYDKEGVSAYGLDRNFVETQLSGFNVKRGMHGRVYAACLIPPNFREDCGRYQNLPIEFMFRDEHINAEIGRFKLSLRRKKATTVIGAEKIEIELDDLTHFKDVGAGKADFANEIVPTFDVAAFDGFEAIFSMIEAIIAHNQAAARRTPSGLHE